MIRSLLFASSALLLAFGSLGMAASSAPVPDYVITDECCEEGTFLNHPPSTDPSCEAIICAGNSTNCAALDDPTNDDECPWGAEWIQEAHCEEFPELNCHTRFPINPGVRDAYKCVQYTDEVLCGDPDDYWCEWQLACIADPGSDELEGISSMSGKQCWVPYVDMCP